MPFGFDANDAFKHHQKIWPDEIQIEDNYVKIASEFTGKIVTIMSLPWPVPQ
jgi:hypothetical protein